ncbi:hypothetical protein BO70DRAFT_317288 [Aspergillus heteromorphus CBS 117.55]|uniref:Xylanolytic transcriptional activator regulatory domain-containing protein n=1 Tax=Aspergillus heteromorphus CBS 117.55 TaxID=1448321 RepID=A0A317VYH1_9EURO|nr:uncharacterized protein BO70DRAFT_317288 [Aspergillus heteromorphus CBS 117.55]PWY78381.1 hypothetical protein BO70DRAFT_317288 [Aspergillus heteromorphus CBS 117.55]
MVQYQPVQLPLSAPESQNPNSALDMSRENSPQPQGIDPTSLVTAPMNNLYDLTRLKNLRNNLSSKPQASPIEKDFISQGVISMAIAEFLFNRFLECNNRMLWDGLLLVHETLDSVRRSSTLLAAAILTVGALHTPNQTDAFHQCYNVFVSLASAVALSRYHSLDDVRALCIGAFYLANLSWKLSGLATRIAAEMGLHQSFHQLMQGDPTRMEHVRVWYATYVCDHQFSIAHGRPPAAVDDESVRNIRQFLQLDQTCPGDVRLAAQVDLFRILTEAYMKFGSDPNRVLDDEDMNKLHAFNRAVEEWQLEWVPRSSDCPFLGTYPSKALDLYSHFARFQLNSLALCSVSYLGIDAASMDALSPAHIQAANCALSAAADTLRAFGDGPDRGRVFCNVPIFTFTMVAFCATFLLKITATWGRDVTRGLAKEKGLNIPDVDNVRLVESLTLKLSIYATQLNAKHLAEHIADGLDGMLVKYRDLLVRTRLCNPLLTSHSPPATNQEVSGENAVWTGEYNLHNLGGTFGFGLDETLLGQMAEDSFEMWSQ